MKTYLLSFILVFSCIFFTYTATLAQSPVGKWKTIDDETGEAKSVVELYEKNGKLYGKVAKLLREDREDPNPTCDKCPSGDDRKDKEVLGMEIIRDLEKSGGEWKDGTVLDPEKGKVYDCKLWLEDDNTLKLRGYVAFFYRTQTWERAD